jgi:protein-disulfide isomerase
MAIEQFARSKGLFDSVVTLLTGVAAVLLIWRLAVPVGPEPPTIRVPEFEDVSASQLLVAVADSPTRGSGSAPVVLMEFSDFECPFCARFERETFGQIDREFIQSGRVEYVVKHFPLSEMHPHARGAAQTAWCAHTKGQFWEMRRALFARRSLAGASWRNIATELGLEPGGFDECLADPASASSIDADEQDGVRVGVSSTPTFFIGRRGEDGNVSLMWRLRGAAPYSVFEAALRTQSGT